MRPAGFFLLRTPRLPAGAADGDPLAVPEVVAALPPDLWAAAERGMTPKVRAAVGRLALRMAGRPVPFGALAAVTVGRVGDATALDVAADVVVREVRTDGGGPARNPTIHVVGERLHYVDPATGAWTAADGLDLFERHGEAALARAGLLVDGGVGALHVDAARAGSVTLGRDAVRALEEAARVLAALTPDRPAPVVEAFARRFAARYGDAEVPLLEALDPETGPGLRDPEPELEWTARERRLVDAVADGGDVWDLPAADLHALAPARPRPLPPAFAVLATLLGDGRIRVHGVSGPGGGRFLGRHAAADPDLAALLREHARAEEALDPDAVFAEVLIGHVDAGAAAVAVRPGTRRAVIDLRGNGAGRAAAAGAALGAGGVDAIALADLRVRVVAGVPVLRCARTDRRVVPRLTTAHAFHRHPNAVYRFLGHLQDPHGTGWMRWDWGPLRSAARLPRVTAGDVVLAPGLWRREDSDVNGLPRRVLLASEGRELPVDLQSETGRAVVARLRGRTAWLEDLATPVVHDEHGRPYRHDLVVPFTDPAYRPQVPAGVPAAGGRASFKPGSGWSTVKLFCGPVAADALLLGPVAESLAGHEWFFLRYPDPEWHLRVRVRGPVAPLLELAADERVYRAELDTYVREAARYGDIEAAERAFAADSRAVVALLGPGLPPARERLRLAAAGVALLLDGRPDAFAALRAAYPTPQRATAADRDAVLALLADPPAPLADPARRFPHATTRALASLAHMHVNRVLRERDVAQEALVYDLVFSAWRAARRPQTAPARTS